MGNLRLERARLAFYVACPILAVYIFSFPSVHANFMKARRYVVYSKRNEEDFAQPRQQRAAQRLPSPDTLPTTPLQ